MKHQTYEEWALMPEYLSAEEQQSLEQHQKECESCRRLADNWNKVENLLLDITPAAPAPGFTARFAASLESRKAQERKRQIRKLIILLSVVFVLTISTVSIVYYTTNSPAAILEGIFKTGAQLVTIWENVKTIAGSIFNLAPVAMVMPVLILGSIFTIGITGVWLATIWKFSLAGGKVQ